MAELTEKEKIIKEVYEDKEDGVKKYIKLHS